LLLSNGRTNRLRNFALQLAVGGDDDCYHEEAKPDDTASDQGQSMPCMARDPKETVDKAEECSCDQDDFQDLTEGRRLGERPHNGKCDGYGKWKWLLQLRAFIHKCTIARGSTGTSAMLADCLPSPGRLRAETTPYARPAGLPGKDQSVVGRRPWAIRGRSARSGKMATSA
jgi:hypothetical protein